MELGDDVEGDRPCFETDGSGAHDPDVPLEVDALLESLEHARRRYLLYVLGEESELTLSDLAARIASWEAGGAPEEVDETARRRAYIALYHAHVPKLEREGVVDFDRRAETITLGPNGRQALKALAGIGGARDATLEAHAKERADD